MFLYVSVVHLTVSLEPLLACCCLWLYRYDTVARFSSACHFCRIAVGGPAHDVNDQAVGVLLPIAKLRGRRSLCHGRSQDDGAHHSLHRRHRVDCTRIICAFQKEGGIIQYVVHN